MVSKERIKQTERKTGTRKKKTCWQIFVQGVVQGDQKCRITGKTPTLEQCEKCVDEHSENTIWDFRITRDEGQGET